ncbi:MAG: hypothetical protein Q9216_005123 [Gyalolechia sp. 2 TL-2023]
MHPLSEPEVYSLAYKARAKLLGLSSAKDQNLRQLISHARLYDHLDVCVEEMRATREKRNSTDHSPMRQAALSPDKNNTSTATARHPPEDHLSEGRVDADCVETVGISECTSTGENAMISYPEITNHTNSHTAYLSMSHQKDNIGGKSPADVKTPSTFEMMNIPSDATGGLQVTVSELAIDDDDDDSSESDSSSNSDWDSDSDSNSDNDGESDAAATQVDEARTPKVVSKSKNQLPQKCASMKRTAHQASPWHATIRNGTLLAPARPSPAAITQE